MGYFQGLNLDIIGLTETKLTKKNGINLEKIQKKDKIFGMYKAWFEGIDDTITKTGEVAILMK